MTKPLEDHELEALLGSDSPYLDDAGFSERVIGALPPRRHPQRLRAGIILGAASIGLGVATLIFPALWTATGWTGLVALSGIATTGIGLAAAEAA
jgi:hypothetical protein